MSYGYVVFDFKMPDYIKEYAVGANAPNIYQKRTDASKGKIARLSFPQKNQRFFVAINQNAVSFLDSTSVSF